MGHHAGMTTDGTPHPRPSTDPADAEAAGSKQRSFTEAAALFQGIVPVPGDPATARHPEADKPGRDDSEGDPPPFEGPHVVPTPPAFPALVMAPPPLDVPPPPATPLMPPGPDRAPEPALGPATVASSESAVRIPPPPSAAPVDATRPDEMPADEMPMDRARLDWSRLDEVPAAVPPPSPSAIHHGAIGPVERSESVARDGGPEGGEVGEADRAPPKRSSMWPWAAVPLLCAVGAAAWLGTRDRPPAPDVTQTAPPVPGPSALTPDPAARAIADAPPSAPAPGPVPGPVPGPAPSPAQTAPTWPEPAPARPPALAAAPAPEARPRPAAEPDAGTPPATTSPEPVPPPRDVAETPLAPRAPAASPPEMASRTAPQTPPPPEVSVAPDLPLPPPPPPPADRRVVVYHRPGATAEAARVADQLRPLATRVDVRAGGEDVRLPTVRYFYPEDEAAARDFTETLPGPTTAWRLQARPNQRPRPPRGNFEIWLTPR